jgi:hypothetical protein
VSTVSSTSTNTSESLTTPESQLPLLAVFAASSSTYIPPLNSSVSPTPQASASAPESRNACVPSRSISLTTANKGFLNGQLGEHFGYQVHGSLHFRPPQKWKITADSTSGSPKVALLTRTGVSVLSGSVVAFHTLQS